MHAQCQANPQLLVAGRLNGAKLAAQSLCNEDNSVYKPASGEAPVCPVCSRALSYPQNSALCHDTPHAPWRPCQAYPQLHGRLYGLRGCACDLAAATLARSASQLVQQVATTSVAIRVCGVHTRRSAAAAACAGHVLHHGASSPHGSPHCSNAALQRQCGVAGAGA